MKSMNIGNSLIKLQTVNSTNQYAAKLLHNQTVAEGTVILAVNQFSGKGQAGNKWESEAGKNLTFSIILYPQFLDPVNQFYLSMSISNGIYNFLKDISLPAKIKWPNDIFISKNKIGGILIENTLMHNKLNSSIIGIGLNINQKSFQSELIHATSVFIETGRETDLDEALENLLKCLNNWISRLYNEQYPVIKLTYLNNLLLMNEWAIYKDHTGEFEGRIVDVNESGQLLVKKRSGEVYEYSFKEIVFQD